MPIAERRSRRPRVFPMRFRDNVPRPLALCPPSSADLIKPSAEICSAHKQLPCEEGATHSPPSSQSSAFSQIIHFRTPANLFRLVRKYFTSSPPSHDPEELFEFPDLCDGHGESDSIDGPNQQHPAPDAVTPGTLLENTSFGPYPNESSFLLGEWYWNGGWQKSLEDFKSLLDIVGRPEFRPGDVNNTKWHAINAQLGSNNFDESDTWLDDTGWRRNPITISVPFHQWVKHPGAKEFSVGSLYHHSLTSVIREKLSNPDDARFFHYEPFELLWQWSPSGEDIRWYA